MVQNILHCICQSVEWRGLLWVLLIWRALYEWFSLCSCFSLEDASQLCFAERRNVPKESVVQARSRKVKYQLVLLIRCPSRSLQLGRCRPKARSESVPFLAHLTSLGRHICLLWVSVIGCGYKLSDILADRPSALEEPRQTALFTTTPPGHAQMRTSLAKSPRTLLIFLTDKQFTDINTKIEDTTKMYCMFIKFSEKCEMHFIVNNTVNRSDKCEPAARIYNFCQYFI